jgi:SAM-dependent methyltransferase
MTSGHEPTQWDPTGLRRTWEALGAEDPFWAVLAASHAHGGAWDEAEFWETGRAQVAATLELLRTRGIAYERDVALDFGCGVGRLAGPFADHFRKVVGLDAARSMLNVARTKNPAGRKVLYVHSPNAALPFRDAAFGFVYSHLVLQHCGADAALGYVSEFARVLRPGGLAVFSMPTRLGDSTTRTWLGRAVETRAAGTVSMDMAAIPIDEMLAFLGRLPLRRELVFTSRDENAIEYGAYLVRKT